VSFKTIREVQNAVWPVVRDSLDRVRESREATKKNPQATESARTRARKPWNRVICEETVWAIAKANMLATPKERAVIDAAQEWYCSWGGFGPEAEDKEDTELYEAVEKFLTQPEPPATVNPITPRT
jgi:hypothetical protein